jgi:L,D-transpeptidase-like protein
VARRIALLVGLVLASSLGGDLSVRAEVGPGLAPRTPEPIVQRPARAIPRVNRANPGTLVAHIRPGRAVAVRSTPRGPVVARLSAQTEFGSPQTLAVARAGHGWLGVITTALPNGRVGWVDAAPRALGLTRTHVTLDVDLSSRVLRVRSGARVARTMRIGIGAAGTPTPTGRFAITDKLNGAAYSPVYGCCILALSGHQTNLPHGWTGGDRLAIHGGSTSGAVSTGCLHASTAALTYLMRTVPLGAQVVIHP